MTFKTKQKTGDDIRLYHTDHLGSTALVTDIDGEVTQHVAYIPYGEIFVEQRNGSWSSPYLFNAKELDEETGLYYYGARYLDPTGTRWLSVDPLFEKYVGMTPYGYCAGNPVKLVDPDGRKVINDDEVPYYGEVEDYVKRENSFYDKYGDNADKLKKSNFNSRAEYKAYKQDRKELKQSLKRTQRLEKYYKNTQKEIDDFKQKCPELFQVMDNLTYTDDNYEEKTLDIHITSNLGYARKNAPSISSMGGAYTDLNISYPKGSGFIASAQIFLGMGLSRGGHLAHEFGHVMSFSILPELYYSQVKQFGASHNCQSEFYLPLRERSFLSMLAIEYQKIYLER